MVRSVGRKLASGKCPEMGANRRYDSNVEPIEPPGHTSDRLPEQIQALNVRGGASDIVAYWRGKALHDLRRFSEAIPALRTATRGDPSKIPLDICTMLARSLLATGDRAGCFVAMTTYAGRMGRADELKSTVCQN